MKIILGAIVVVFIFWGIGTFRSQRLSVIAKVNGEEILQGQFQHAYAQAIERYSKMFGGSIPENLLKQLNVKQQVLNTLIDEAIIRQSAEKMGIRVSEDEIKDIILTFPNFKRNGVFDKRLYDMALRQSGLTPIQFEGLIRQQLMTDKVRELLFSGIMVTRGEVEEYYKFQNQEINLIFVKIPSDACRGEVNSTESALMEWYEAHKANYETLPEIKIRYIEFSKDNVLKTVKVSEDAIRSYYETHREVYKIKERRRARHILIRVPMDVDNATMAEMEKKAEEILQKARSGEDFSELAKKYSEDPGSAESGGDLGFFTREMMVKPFSDKVFAMKEGEISGPVRTRFGLHIIKLDKIEPSRTQTLKEVEAEIEDNLKTKKANDILWEMANKAYDKIIDLGGLDEYAREANVTIKEAGPFSKESPPATIGHSTEALNVLFSLEKGELSSLLPVSGGIVIAELLDKIPPRIPPFEQVKEKVKEEFVQEEAVRLCEKRAKALLQKARKEGLEKAAAQEGLKIHETGYFKRVELSRAKGLPTDIAKAGLYLYEDKPLCEEPKRVGRDFYCYALKERRSPDLTSLSKEEEDKLRSKLLNKKHQEAFSQWLAFQRQQAKIVLLSNL